MPQPPEQVVGFLAANVRRTRLRRGLTQEELAEAADLSTVHLQRIERGAADIRVTALARLAEALGVQPGTLLRPSRPQKRRAGRPTKKGTRR
ncbi:MAG: helix-turn-helix domain-containing protein [Myxococcota bacterium]